MKWNFLRSDMNKINRLTRRVAYKNRWMKVHEDTVQFPDGTEGIYGVVDKEDFVLIIPRHNDGRFQLVQQFRYPVGARFWEFPQGSWETQPGSDPVKVALGELEEETGYKARSAAASWTSLRGLWLFKPGLSRFPRRSSGTRHDRA